MEPQNGKMDEAAKTHLKEYCRDAGLQYFWYHGFNKYQEYWETDLKTH